MRLLYAAVAAILAVGLLSAADPAPPAKAGIVILGFTTPNPTTAAKVSVAPGRFVPITAADGSPSYIEDAAGYRVYRVAKGSVYVGVKYDAAENAEPEENVWDADVMVLLARPAPGTYKIQLVKNGEGKGPPVRNGAPIDLEVQGAIPPPKPPKPEPPKPEPVVVKSFRVFLVYESMNTLTGPQNSVIYWPAVEDFLNATCTGGKLGWARRDKDTSGKYDTAKQSVWDAVKADFAPPKNTKTPAVVIQVNDKITIEPLPPTPAAMVELLKKYSEGK
jgi:hypothetical protein